MSDLWATAVRYKAPGNPAQSQVWESVWYLAEMPVRDLVSHQVWSSVFDSVWISAEIPVWRLVQSLVQRWAPDSAQTPAESDKP